MMKYIEELDAGTGLFVCGLIIFMGLAVIFIGFFVLAPLAVLALAIWLGYKYATRPIITPTTEMYAQTEQRVIAANFPSPDDFVESLNERILERVLESQPPAYTILATMEHVSRDLYEAERFGNPLPPIPSAGTIEDGRYRDMLIAFQKKTADAPRTMALFSGTLARAYLDLITDLPGMAKTDRKTLLMTDDWEPFATYPLLDVLPRPGRAVEDLIAPFFAEEAAELGIFTELRRQLERNTSEAFPDRGKAVLPSAYQGSAEEIIRTYLKNTPLEMLFHAPVPFSFEDRARLEHMHVVGGSGHGKTQLLQHLILSDLQKEEPPALIVIDSQGEMLRKIQRLALFAPGQPLADRLVVIDPEDVAHPPALNMFDTTNARLSGYSAAHREQIEAGVIELYNYVFGALAAELTQKQGTAFAYVTRLMLSIPGASIHSLRELMEDTAPGLAQSPFAAHIAKLDATSQAFFQNQFFSKSFAPTKQQIARRLYGVLQVPAFDRMFSPKMNRLDLFEAIQARKVVLINTSKALLKSDASALFGRYMIALAMMAAFERIAVRGHRPAYLIIDEAAEYFDENLERLLTQARKFNLGVLFAHQHLDQLSPALRSTVAANTSIKLAGGVSDRDARSLAADMRTSADTIASMRKSGSGTEFSCYVRNLTERALRLEIPFGTLEAAPKMTKEQEEALVARNRERYAVSPEPARTEPANLPPQGETQAHASLAPPVSAPAPESDDWRS